MLINKLDPFVVLQYISSSIDVIINLKFEDIENKMLEKADGNRNSIEDAQVSINDTPDKIKRKQAKLAKSARAHSRKESRDIDKFPDNQSTSSAGAPSCPKVFEEIIQGLEADIRKHIRIEHQLKLHIESVEDRVEELEREAEKIKDQPDKIEKLEQENKSLKS